MCSRPKSPPAPPPPPQLPPAPPPPPPPTIKAISEETGQMRPGPAMNEQQRAGAAQGQPGRGGLESVFSLITRRRGKAALTIPR